MIDDEMTCHANCDYASYGMYGDKQNQAMLCKTCRANCLKCTSQLNCNECSYSKKRMEGPVNINNFLSSSAAGTLSCSTGITQ